MRKIIYTTNIIEGLNRQFRQITKNKPSFTNDDSLRRMPYLASQRIVKHWHARYQNWDLGAQPAGDHVRRPSRWLTPCPSSATAARLAFTARARAKIPL
ncbi:MAG: transposase [Dysosmobacter sp.]